jgi:hypothetical protein
MVPSVGGGNQAALAAGSHETIEPARRRDYQQPSRLAWPMISARKTDFNACGRPPIRAAGGRSESTHPFNLEKTVGRTRRSRKSVR